MKKNTKKTLLISLFLFTIGLIIYFGFTQQAFFGAGYQTYATNVNILSETNEYIEYQIPFSIVHGNLMGSCSEATNFDISFVTYPSPFYFDGRSWGGSEMTLPASSPIKNTNIELNREFNGEVSVSANLVWNPCADTTTNVNPVPYVNTICKVKDYTNDKQNIECSINGYFNGISSSPLPGIPANTEITGALKVTSFSGGNIKVKMYKIGYPIIQNKTYYRLENNLCSQISILELEKTFNDYDTLEECQSKTIVYENLTYTNITIEYNISDIDDSIMCSTNSDCESNCVNYDVYECLNNICICKNNDNPNTIFVPVTVEKEFPYWLYIIIALFFISLIIFLYYILKKK